MTSLLQIATFSSKDLEGIWEYVLTPIEREDELYDQRLKKRSSEDKSEDFLKWLKENSLDKTSGGYAFQGGNGTRCIISIPTLVLIKQPRAPPMDDRSIYKLPFETPCVYQTQTKVVWQPKDLKIPRELIEVLNVYEYHEKNNSQN